MSIESENEESVKPSSRPVIYRREDYVGFFRHLLIFAADGFVIFISIVLVITAASIIGGSNPGAFGLLGPTFSVAFVWWYLAVLKPSKMRSPGYWIADARIVTLYGEPPSRWRMTYRMMWFFTWLFGFPVDVVTDLLFTTMGDDRQMLRDLICETRLIRNSAKPIGEGKVSYCLFTGLGRTLYYARVR